MTKTKDDTYQEGDQIDIELEKLQRFNELQTNLSNLIKKLESPERIEFPESFKEDMLQVLRNAKSSLRCKQTEIAWLHEELANLKNRDLNELERRALDTLRSVDNLRSGAINGLRLLDRIYKQIGNIAACRVKPGHSQIALYVKPEDEGLSK